MIIIARAFYCFDVQTTGIEIENVADLSVRQNNKIVGLISFSVRNINVKNTTKPLQACYIKLII